VSVALPELPDDRWAQPPQHGRNDVPSGWDPPGAPGPPGTPDRRAPVQLPSTPWPVGSVAPAHPGANGHAFPYNAPAAPQNDRPIAAHGRDIARFAVPDDPPRPAGPAPGGPIPRSTGPIPVDPGPQQGGRHPLPPSDVPGGQVPRRVHSDVPPPRRPDPGAGVHPALAGFGAGTAEVVEPPTVPDGLARATEPVAEDPGEDGPAEIPRRRRRRSSPPDAFREQAAAEGRKSRGGKRRRSTFWKELPILVVVALLLTFLIQTFVAKVYVIPSGSMETTLHGCTGCTNDRVLVDKITYRFSDPKPGDVVVFRGPDGWTSEFTAEEPGNVVVRALQSLGSLIGLAPPDEKDFIKRVIAVGGQTVQCCDSRNRVLVDGKPLDEPYIYFLPEAGPARQDAFGPVTVPAGTLWMMGDSRNNSADSRVPGHGSVPISNVIGRARFIVLPFARVGAIPSPNPQTTAAALGAGDTGAPVALGMIGLLPLVGVRRRERDLGEFLPRRRT
jgi:signal peptidase I